MTKKQEALHLAREEDYPAERVVPLNTRVYTGPDFGDGIELIDQAFGENIPQGSLFAYLFRRFGHPNLGSDPYKDLCSYLLTTTDKRMLMKITPYAGGDSTISISFHVSDKDENSRRDWVQEDRRKHQTAFCAWIEETGQVPEWSDRLIEEAKKGGWPMTGEGWERILNVLAVNSVAYSQGYKKDEETPAEVQWYDDVKSQFEKDHPYPDMRYRDPDWTNWPDEDPLKTFAAAIHETANDLRRPVWVRDCPIDPWGQYDENRDMTNVDGTGYANSAGYPSGYLGNINPELFSEIADLIRKIGEGDSEKGMARAIKALETTALDFEKTA